MSKTGKIYFDYLLFYEYFLCDGGEQVTFRIKITCEILPILANIQILENIKWIFSVKY